MNLKAQVIAINKFLSDIYDEQDMRLSYLLTKLDFNHEDIKLINQKFLSNVVAIFLKILKETIVSFQDGERKFSIIKDIYGLNGDRSLGLRQIGTELNISHERVRQIKQKVVRRLTSENSKFIWESEFKQEVRQLLEQYNNCAKLDTKMLDLSQNHIFYPSMLPNGEKCLNISSGNNKIIIYESNFQEFYNNLLHNIKSLEWDNLYNDKIENIRKEYSKAYETWTREEEEELKKYLIEGLSVKEIAELLERKPGAISSRINKLGLRQ